MAQQLKGAGDEPPAPQPETSLSDVVRYAEVIAEVVHEFNQLKGLEKGGSETLPIIRTRIDGANYRWTMGVLERLD